MSNSDILANAILSAIRRDIAADKRRQYPFGIRGGEDFRLFEGGRDPTIPGHYYPGSARKRHWDGYHQVIGAARAATAWRRPRGSWDQKDGPGLSLELRCAVARRGSELIGLAAIMRDVTEALRGDARAEAKARGGNEALPLTARRS